MITLRDAMEQLAGGDYLSLDEPGRLTRIIIVLSLHQQSRYSSLCESCEQAWPCLTVNTILYGGVATQPGCDATTGGAP